MESLKKIFVMTKITKTIYSTKQTISSTRNKYLCTVLAVYKRHMVGSNEK